MSERGPLDGYTVLRPGEQAQLSVGQRIAIVEDGGSARRLVVTAVLANGGYTAVPDDTAPRRDALREAFELAREAQAAGLVVTMMAPHRCGHSSGSDDAEFQVGLYGPDGMLWAEGTHESAELIREQHIGRWLRHQQQEETPSYAVPAFYRDGRVFASPKGGVLLRCVGCGRPAGDQSFTVDTDGVVRCDPGCADAPARPPVPVGLDERVAAVRAARPELGAVLDELDVMLGGDPYQEGRYAVKLLEHLEALPAPYESVDRAMQDVRDAQKYLAHMMTQAAQQIASAQVALARAFTVAANAKASADRSPDKDCVFIDVSGSVVTMTQTTDRELRVAVNGAWTVLPVRERVSVDFGLPPLSAHLVLPHPTRQEHEWDPQPGEVVAYLSPLDVARRFRLADGVRITGAWVEDEPPRFRLRLRGDVDLVRAAFPGATEFDGPREEL